MDGAPNSEEKRQKQMAEVIHQNKLLKIFRVKRGCRSVWRAKTVKLQIRLLLKKILALFVSTDVLYKYINMCKKYDYDKANIVVDLACPFYGEREYHNKTVMSSYMLHPFEDAEFYIMVGYDEYLKNIYRDYMQLPPIEKRTTTHTFNTFYFI